MTIFKKDLNEKQKKEVERQIEIYQKGTAQIVPLWELEIKLATSVATNTPLKVKLGLDPTAPDVHLGHTVVLNKLKQFQENGHIVQLVIGDFTGKIGDPTDKAATRKQLTQEEVEANAKTYFDQFGKIIDMEKVELHYNSTWLSQISFEKILELASQITVSKLMERNDFADRLNNYKPIGLHEFFYPIMQGFDSVELQSDIEIGGTDQHFNLLMGRHFQERARQEKQVAIMMPLLEGLDGKDKMSKSKNNYIGIDESPKEIYGKTMSLPDELILKYFELITDLNLEDLEKIQAQVKNKDIHPRSLKMKLAKKLVEMMHGVDQADLAEEEFVAVFQNKSLPKNIEQRTLSKDTSTLLIDVLVEAGMISSKTEARKMIRNNGVSINGEKVTDETLKIEIGKQIILQVGKRKFLKIKLD